MNNKGYSMLELLVAMVIGTLMIALTLEILEQTRQTAQAIAVEMESSNDLQYCLDRLSDDVVQAAFSNAQFKVDQRSKGDQILSHLRIMTGQGKVQGKEVKGNHIDWITEANDDETLTLYRREFNNATREDAVFVPLCNNLFSFDVELLNSAGLEDPNQAPAMLQVRASHYANIEERPESIRETSKTFCLRRDIIMTLGAQKATPPTSNDTNNSNITPKSTYSPGIKSKK
ncbi:MAG: prepilin-type N-terminal cleavage/methylation domain-containing protein [Phycisphaerae bacterium]|nr:prepilin-type N-terminal cleavage/methylation domain-containing protein [Phycisphaerae bacterium]